MHKMTPTINNVRSRLPAAPTKEHYPIENINSKFSNVVIPNKENIALFLDSIPRGMKMKLLNSQVKEGIIHLKAFPGVKANQLNHYVNPTLAEFDYDCGIIHVRRDQGHSSKQRYVITERHFKQNNENKNNLSKLQHWKGIY